MRENARYSLLQTIIFAASAIALLSYTSFRAASLGITFDEALTFREFVPQSFWDIVTLDSVSANNHIFHTLLVKLFTGIFGDSTLVIRVPNLISHALFLFFTWRFSTKVKPAVPFFILLNAHLVVLEMFGLARGYGLAIGLMIGALWFLVQFLESRRLRNLNLCLGLAVLCVYANFSFLLVFVSIIGLLTLFIFQESDKSVWKTFRSSSKQLRVLVLFTVLLAVLIVHPIKQLHRWDMFYYGGTTGFWQDTVSSVANSWLYGMNAEIGRNGLLTAIALLLAVSFLTYFKNNGKLRINGLNAVIVVFIFAAIISILQFHIFNTRYLIDRTALFFLPLLLLGTSLLNGDAVDSGVLRYSRNILFSVFAVALAVHAFCFGNVTHSTFWPADANTPEMINIITADIPQAETTPVIVGIRWKHDPCLRYYLEREKITHIVVDSSWGLNPNSGSDYYYLDESDTAFLSEQGKTIIRRFEISGTVLAR